MRYCTMADLTAVIPMQTLQQLSNDNACSDTVNKTVIEAMVTQAEEVVDGYLRGRYQLPLDPVPTLVKQYTIALARYFLYARRPEGNDLPDAVKATYADAHKGLKMVQNGELHLGIKATGQDVLSAGEFRTRSRKRVFGSSVLDRYV